MVNYSKSLLLLAAGIAVFVVQTAGFVIAVDYFGYFGAVAIPWSILILYIIWNKDSLKAIFTSDEEEE